MFFIHVHLVRQIFYVIIDFDVYAPYLTKSDAKLMLTLLKTAETESYQVTESEEDLKVSEYVKLQYVVKVSIKKVKPII